MSPKRVALAASILLHGLALAALSSHSPPAPDPAPPRTVEVRLLQKVAKPSGSDPAVGATGVAPTVGSDPEGGYYYWPEELDRGLIPLRDRTGDAGIDIEQPIVMQLFVDARGRVAAVRFDGVAPPLLLQAQLRIAFSAIEFLPAQKGGRAVPARIRIELLPPPPQQPEGA